MSSKKAPLTPCPDCGHQVSTRAKACPQCGRVTNAHKDRRFVTIWVAAVVLMLVAAAAFAWNQDRLKHEREGDNVCSLLGDC